MELAELLGLLQYEVQKSYEFAEHLAKRHLAEGEVGPEGMVLHIALERVELDIPLFVVEGNRRFNRNAREIKGLPIIVKRFRFPYSPEHLSRVRVGVPKGEIEGKTIEVRLFGPKENGESEEGIEWLGRLKVVLVPVLK